MKLLDWIDKNKLSKKLNTANNKITFKNIYLHPDVIKFLDDNIYKIEYWYWYYLSANPNAIELLKDNQDKIDWSMFSTNPSIFTYDYEKMRDSNQDLKEEIIAKALHPKRIFRLIETYGEDEIYDIYFDD